MKSVKVEAFVEMLKLIGFALVGAGVAYLIINFFSFTALMVICLVLALYFLFRAQCVMIEIRREREAAEAKRAAEKA